MENDIFKVNNTKHMIEELKENIKKDNKFEKLYLDSLFDGDNSSFSNTSFIKQTQIKFNLNFKLDKKLEINGDVTIKFELKNELSEKRLLVLDTNNLEILSVEYSHINKENKKENENSILEIKYSQVKDFYLFPNSTYPKLGKPLIIEFSDDQFQNINKNKEFYLKIKYSTNGNVSSNKCYSSSFIRDDYPFGYTDHEAIGARASFPCQDTPSAKVTFEACLIVESPLVALASGIKFDKLETSLENMSLKNFEDSENKNTLKYFYKQNIPVSTYLIVFACGNIKEVSLSKRCKLYAVDEDMPAAKESYKDIEKVISTAEKLIGIDYQWEEFNLLIVPYYPFEGMENPYLTFIDRKKIKVKSLLYHELMHFWVGNLMTNKHWECFWINEGINTYLEIKMIRRLEGEEQYKNKLVAYKDSLESMIIVNRMNNEEPSLTTLHPNYHHGDPTDYWNTLPYVKGCLLLLRIEELVEDEEIVLSIIRQLVLKYKFSTLDSKELVDFFNSKLEEIEKNKGISIIPKIFWEKWLNEPFYQ